MLVLPVLYCVGGWPCLLSRRRPLLRADACPAARRLETTGGPPLCLGCLGCTCSPPPSHPPPTPTASCRPAPTPDHRCLCAMGCTAPTSSGGGTTTRACGGRPPARYARLPRAAACPPACLPAPGVLTQGMCRRPAIEPPPACCHPPTHPPTHHLTHALLHVDHHYQGHDPGPRPQAAGPAQGSRD